MASYPGGKNGSGSYQQIISEIPVHTQYIEPFFGSGAVFWNKAPALVSVLCDIDPSVFVGLERSLSGYGVVHVECGNAVAMLDRMFQSSMLDPGTFIYLDPPYLFSTRRSGDNGIYKNEFGTEEDHIKLLELVVSIGSGCNIAISGYWSELYNSMLESWRVKSWNVRTRKGCAVEYLWMNYSTPALLHDPRYVGSNFTERQRLRRLAGFEQR